MTAEISVLNKSAVVLAADSAVTVDGAGGTKIYHTARKLFRLVNDEPVGVMIYNDTELGGLPWETILKEFRRKHPAPESTVDAYVASLVGFLNGNTDLFPADQQLAVSRRIAWRCLGGLAPAVGELRRKKQDLTESQAIRTIVGEKLGDLGNAEFCDGFDEAFEITFAREQRRWILQCAERLFKRKRFPPGVRDQLCLVVARCFSRDELAARHTGVVIGGFGADEYLPRMRELRVETIVGGRLKWKRLRSFSVSQSERSEIFAFAQQDVIDTLLSGVNPEFQVEFLFGSLAMSLATADRIVSDIKELSAKKKAVYRAGARQLAQERWKAYIHRMNEFRETTFAAPVRTALEGLSPEDLANVAESLVGITSLRQRISRNIETVGGPVDVAIISRGDGFAWYRRK